jgi:hypothetical protein
VFRDATAAIRSFRLCVFLVVLTSATTAGFAQAPASAAGLDALLERLHASASPEAYRQIAAAVAASSALRVQLNELTAAGSLTEDRPLSPRQVGQLFMNARYRFAFSQAIRSTDAPLRLLQSGAIEVNEANTRAISTVLKHSQIADVE